VFKGTMLILLSILAFSCRKDEIAQNDVVLNHYIIAGHAYGTPDDKPPALYKKLLPVLAYFQSTFQPIQFIFTGDVAYKATPENWKNIQKQFDSLGIDFWIAPGNHEFYTSYFLDSVQTEAYFTRRVGNNLFIILNTNFAGWTIDEPQIEMIKKEFENLDDINNIFVFSHQLWFSSGKDRPFDLYSVGSNSAVLLEGPTSFWTDAFPLFEDIEKPSYFFAGDLGSWDWTISYSFQQHKNHYFYASGMGSGLDDHVLHIKTYVSGKVEINKVNF